MEYLCLGELVPHHQDRMRYATFDLITVYDAHKDMYGEYIRRGSVKEQRQALLALHFIALELDYRAGVEDYDKLIEE